MERRYSNEEIKVLEYLSDGKEHFEEPDIDNYDEICESLSEMGLVDLGKTKDEGIKLTNKGRKVLNEERENLTKLEYTI